MGIARKIAPVEPLEPELEAIIVALAKAAARRDHAQQISQSSGTATKQ